MTKKIILILMLCCFIISCGKKGDPVYKDENQNSGRISAQISVFS